VFANDRYGSGPAIDEALESGRSGRSMQTKAKLGQGDSGDR
jgi:hypothetical protein